MKNSRKIIIYTIVLLSFVVLSLTVTKGCIGRNSDNSESEIINVDSGGKTTADHTHTVAEKEQIVESAVEGYCGNTQTTIYFENGESFTFMYGESVEMTDILINLDYKKSKVCKCLPEYTVDTEFGTGYGVNLSEGYARCGDGQADLTKQQIEKLGQIIQWAKGKAKVS